MQKTYAIFDNVQVSLQPLYCSLGATLKQGGALLNTIAGFKNICISDGSQPVVYVNSATANFNISGQMTVTNIHFTGINALAVPTNVA